MRKILNIKSCSAGFRHEEESAKIWKAKYDMEIKYWSPDVIARFLRLRNYIILSCLMYYCVKCVVQV